VNQQIVDLARYGAAGPPEARNARSAFRTAAFSRQAILEHKVPSPFNHQSPAAWTPGVFEIAYPAIEISSIHVPQAGIVSDRSRSLQRGSPGVCRTGHFVTLMERGNMPRNIRGDARQESGEGT
jgi:hypothetical protein